MTDSLFVDTSKDTLRTGWASRHNDAVMQHRWRKNGRLQLKDSHRAEHAILSLVDGIEAYAATMSEPDGVLTPALMEMVSGFRTLLNGDLGRLDGGTLDGWAWALAERLGWDLDIEDWKEHEVDTGTYLIKRMYQRDDVPTETITRGLTLEQAQAHCRNPETSSSTATSEAAQERTRQYGPWFDGYEAE